MQLQEFNAPSKPRLEPPADPRHARLRVLEQLFLGHAPSSLLPGSEQAQSLRVLRLGSSSVREENVSLDTLIVRSEWVRQGKRAFWVDCCDAPATVHSLIGSLGLTSVVSAHQETSELRVEVGTEHVLVVFRELDGDTVTAVLGGNLLFSFHGRPAGCVARTVDSLRRLHLLGPVGADVVLFSLLREVLQAALTALDLVYGEIAALEGLVQVLGSAEQSDLLRRIGATVARITTVRAFLTSLGLLLRELLRCKHLLSREVIGYLARLEALQSQSLDRAALASKFVTAISATYLSKSSLAVAENTEEASIVLRRYNVLTSVMLPLLLIQGMFSMNVLIPGKTGYPGNDTLAWFFGLLASFVVLSASMLVVMIKLRWW